MGISQLALLYPAEVQDLRVINISREGFAAKGDLAKPALQIRRFIKLTAQFLSRWGLAISGTKAGIDQLYLAWNADCPYT
ncbi:hypothetical protein [Microbulbifer epialgicus]|uniref:Uncharacterized protein n=1 Tax=Microbulbifer epialgicus TaxID=393907 RepID=A0ABV4NWZ3_9GAMM